MHHRRILLACLLLCWSCSTAVAQIRNPNNLRYQRFGQNEPRNEWATNPPVIADPGPGDESSMSPDNWSTLPAPSDTTPGGIESSETSPQDSDPTPSIPDLDAESPFRPSSFSRASEIDASARRLSSGYSINQEPQAAIVDVPKSNSTRYPLGSVGVYDPSKFDSPSERQFDAVENWYESSADADSSGIVALPPLPNYRPDLGHCAATPTYRSVVSDDHAQVYNFGNQDGDHPSIKEILATGRFFGSASALYFRAAFQGNTAIATRGPGFGESIPFDFDYESAPQFRFGFESKAGPGMEFEYWQYDETSNISSFTSDGTITGSTSTWMLGPLQWSRLTASNPGERLDASHSIDAEVFSASFFKEMKFKISRLNGIFGFQYSGITQSMDSTLSSGGTETGRLSSRSDLSAWGPKFGLEYYRPMGHTKLELFTTVGGSVLFGKRDQFVSNTVSGDFDRIDADEFVTMVDFLTGIQYKKVTAENRCYYARLGLNYQTWIGGGTAVEPQGDFGLRGFSFGVGYNR